VGKGRPRVRLERCIRRVRHDQSSVVQGHVLALEGVCHEAIQRVVPRETGCERVHVTRNEQVVLAVLVDDVGPFEFLIDTDGVEQRILSLPVQWVTGRRVSQTDTAVELLLGRIAATDVTALRNGRVGLEQQIRLACPWILEEPRVSEGVNHATRLVLSLVTVTVGSDQLVVGPWPLNVDAVVIGHRSAARRADDTL